MPRHASPPPAHGPEPADGLQRVGGLALLPLVLHQYGATLPPLLAECGLPPDVLDDPEKRIPFPKVGELLHRAAAHSGCDHLGLVLGRRLGLDTLGLLGEAARCAPTVGDALRAISEHQRLHTRGCLIFLRVDDTQAFFGYSVYSPATTGVEHIHDSIAVWMLNAVRSLTQPSWLPDRIQLARGRPPSIAKYRRTLSARLEFDGDCTALVFDRATLNLRPPGADPARFELLESRVVEQVRRSVLNELRRALRIEMIGGGAMNDRVSRMLDLHRRTLHRQLRQQDTSFRQVLDEVRYDTARHLLRLTDMPLLQVATSLGYGDVTSFTRAFRRWSGASPGRFRQGTAAPR
jgi:AraC-like DNA-binding protein